MNRLAQRSTCAYARAHTHTHTDIHTYAWAHTDTQTCAHTHIHTQSLTHPCACTSVCLHTHARLNKCMCSCTPARLNKSSLASVKNGHRKRGKLCRQEAPLPTLIRAKNATLVLSIVKLLNTDRPNGVSARLSVWGLLPYLFANAAWHTVQSYS
jgi:hypothetical protein